jgi:hypothetical protein
MKESFVNRKYLFYMTVKSTIKRVLKEQSEEWLDITPEDLGISSEMMAECEKNPSRAFDILFSVFGNNPGIIQKTIQKIGKRLQQKIMSGSIRPQEIAREAEELMKEFAGNSSFVDMMDGIKGAFGFEDMDLARKAGKEGSARLSMVRNRLKKKASEKEAKKAAASTQMMSVNSTTMADTEAAMASLLSEEANKKKKKQPIVHKLKKLSYDKNSQDVQLIEGMPVIARISCKEYKIANNDTYIISKFENDTLWLKSDSDETNVLKLKFLSLFKDKLSVPHAKEYNLILFDKQYCSNK